MAASRVLRPQQRSQLQTGTLIDGDPAKVSRHLSDLATAVSAVQSKVTDRTQATVNLVVGDNLVNHGLGRAVRGATITPSVADASFAWALKSSTATQATITVVGVDQPGAFVELF